MLKYMLGILFPFVLLIFASVYLNENKPLSDSEDEYELLTNREMWVHFLWVHEEYGFRPSCIGGNMPNGAVKTVDASMRGSAKVSLDEARIILLCCIEDLLTRINAKRELRPYLQNYPFTPVNVSYSISFDDLKAGSVQPPFITDIHTFRGIVLYTAWDKESGEGEKILRESYEDAERKASAENCKTHPNAKL